MEILRDGLVACLEEHLLGDLGHRDGGSRVVHAGSVLLRPEQLDLAVFVPERLQTLEARRAVVERDRPDCLRVLSAWS